MADLADDFENEQDLALSFDNEPEYVAPTLAQKVTTGAQNAVTPSVETQEAGAGMLQNLGESALDTARGVGKGLTMNSVDELGGMLSAGAESLYNKFNPTDVALREQGFQIEEPNLTDLYTKNQKAIQSELSTSSERSPVLDIVGQIGGGMTSGSVLGSALGLTGAAQKAQPLLDIAKNQGKMKAGIELLKRGAMSYAKASPGIALEGALSSQDGTVLTPEGRAKLGEDTVGALAFGLPAVFGLQAATDIVGPAASKATAAVKKAGKEAIADSPLLRQMEVSFDYGKRGINPRSTSTQLATDSGTVNLAELDNDRVKKLMKEIQTADKTIGKAVGDSLETATAAGQVVNLSPDAKQSLAQLQSIAKQNPELADNSRVRQIFDKIAQNGGEVTPVEARELIDYTDAYINKFKTATNTTPLDQAVLQNLMSTRKNFATTLRNAVPEYAKAADRMSSFRTAVPETIIARSRPVDIDNKYYGNLKDQDKQLFDSLKALVQGTTKPGASSAETRTAFVNTIKGLKEFETGEAARLASGEIQNSALSRPASAIEEQIKKFSDDAVARGSMDAISPQAGVGGIAKEALIGVGAETGRSVALSAANKAGMMSRRVGQAATQNPVARLGRNLYNAPNETVQALADQLQSTPGLERYGKQLADSIQNGNNNRKNQVLFTIMQNPSARAIVGTEEEEN